MHHFSTTITTREEEKPEVSLPLALTLAKATLVSSSYRSGVRQWKQQRNFVSNHEYLFSLGSLERYV